MALDKINWAEYGKDTCKAIATRTGAIVVDKYDNLPWFLPITDKLYKFTVVGHNGWNQKVNVYSHVLQDVDGKFKGKVSCKKKWVDDYCPLCAANDEAEEKTKELLESEGVKLANNWKLENDKKPFPRKSSFILPVIIDDDEGGHKFAFFRTWESQLEQITTQLRMINGQFKLAMSKTGAGRHGVNYNIVSTQEPVSEQQIIDALETLPIASTHYLIDAVDYEKIKLDFLTNESSQINSNDTLYTEVKAAPTTNNQDPFPRISVQREPNTKKETPPQQTALAENVGVSQEALEYVISCGSEEGKKLTSLDNKMLERIANSLTGDVKKYAEEILRARS